MTVVRNVKGKVVGQILGNRYYTTRNTTKHFFVNFRGYGISKYIVDILEKTGVEVVMIKEIGIRNTKILLSRLDDWLEAPTYTDRSMGEVDEQLILCIDKMEVK